MIPASREPDCPRLNHDFREACKRDIAKHRRADDVGDIERRSESGTRDADAAVKLEAVSSRAVCVGAEARVAACRDGVCRISKVETVAEEGAAATQFDGTAAPDVARA